METSVDGGDAIVEVDHLASPFLANWPCNECGLDVLRLEEVVPLRVCAIVEEYREIRVLMEKGRGMNFGLLVDLRNEERENEAGVFVV